jgi:hypothetical protein
LELGGAVGYDLFSMLRFCFPLRGLHHAVWHRVFLLLAAKAVFRRPGTLQGARPFFFEVPVHPYILQATALRAMQTDMNVIGGGVYTPRLRPQSLPPEKKIECRSEDGVALRRRFAGASVAL